MRKRLYQLWLAAVQHYNVGHSHTQQFVNTQTCVVTKSTKKLVLCVPPETAASAICRRFQRHDSTNADHTQSLSVSRYGSSRSVAQFIHAWK